MGSTNFQLNDIINSLNIKTPFKGCVMKDELKNLKKTENEYGICNTQDSSQNGRHWFLWFIRNGQNYYFDSYGSPILPELREYLGENIMSSTFQIQSWDEEDKTMCGEYCCLVAYLLSRNCRFEDIVLELVHD